MNILLWIIFGGLAGWIASIITHSSIGIFGDIVVGIIGAFIGGWIADRVSVGGEAATGSERPTSVAGFVWAVIGSIVLLAIINFIFR